MNAKATKANRDVLVLGGGIAGMQTALLLAEKNHRVHLLESEPSVGGFFPLLDRTFPTNSCGVCFMSPSPPAMCPIYEGEFHENIDLLPNSALESFSGAPGNFTATYVQGPRFVDPRRCTLCGRCAEVCPVVVPRKLGGGIEHSKAIDMPWAQSVPRTYSIDESACTRCGECVNVCEPGAISFDRRPTRRTIEVGAVVLGFGFEPFDPALRGEYGYGRYQNVISSIQYERMLSRGGPGGGMPVRPSDGKRPRRIAFIQCVGSRDKSCGRPYCSSICCMYATKQAMISRDRDTDADAVIFYMDVRPMGKGYEHYYERARSEYSIRYCRSAVSTVRELHRSKNLSFTYVSEGGELTEEEFDLVVLSVGFSAPKDSKQVARLLGVELDEFGFCWTDELRPGATSVPGIFVAGAFAGPKDIPETVVEASAVASDVSALLDTCKDNYGDKSEHTSGESREPRRSLPDGSVSSAVSEDEEVRIGVFFCDVAGQLAAGLDLKELTRELRRDADVAVTRTIDAAAPAKSAEQVRRLVEEKQLNRVVLAGYRGAAVARAIDGTCPVARAGIGEQCLDVHRDNPELAREKARTLLCAALAQVRAGSAVAAASRKIDGRVLVIGGGLAGLTAAVSLADQGMKVTLVEKQQELGGNALSTPYTLAGSDLRSAVTKLVSRTESHPGIEVLRQSELESFEGTWGSFRSRVSTAGETREIVHGALIVATGGRQAAPDEYLYGSDRRVVTQRELEHMIASGDETPKQAQSVVMIQCVGSRDERRPYCSRICCGQAVKNACKLKEYNPEADVYVFYRDVRTYGFMEKHYQEARERGVVFVRYEPEAKPVVSAEGGKLVVTYRDPAVGEPRTVAADLAVLSNGLMPGSDTGRIAQLAGLDLTRDGFFAEANPKAAPLDSVKRGVYYCGLCHSPNYSQEVILQAKAAAARASALLWKGDAALSGNQAYVNERRCSGCGLCVTACPYDARRIDEVSGKARVIADLCKGCGTCAVVCPNGASQQHGYESVAILSVVDAVAG